MKQKLHPAKTACLTGTVHYIKLTQTLRATMPKYVYFF